MSKGFIQQWITKAIYASFCSETGNKINIGDEILYIPKSKHCSSQVFCKNSKTYKSAEKDPSNVGYL